MAMMVVFCYTRTQKDLICLVKTGVQPFP